MGANGSRPGAHQEGSEAPQDLYELLDIETDATYDEIKKAFRKKALREHPDKAQPEDREEATKRFIKVQQAYEVLSDPQERAWYDNHREEILRGPTDDGEVDLNAANEPKAQKVAARVSIKALMKFFSTTSWKGYDESNKSFYTVFRQLFELIVQDEINATPYPGDPPFRDNVPDYPSFGYKDSLYMESVGDQPPVKEFYTCFQNFSSRKAFSNFDHYRPSDAPDRKYKRAMEKENKRARDEARKEYSDTVRALASFIKKRDPRFQNSPYSDPVKMQQQQAEKFKNEQLKLAQERARKREELAREYREQERLRKGKAHDEGDTGESGLDDDDDSDGQDIEEWHCAVCEKTFSTLGSWENHERSRKHIKTVERIRKELAAEDELLGIDGDEPNGFKLVGEEEKINQDEISLDEDASDLGEQVNDLDISDKYQDIKEEKKEDENDAKDKEEVSIMQESKKKSTRNYMADNEPDQKPPKKKDRQKNKKKGQQPPGLNDTENESGNVSAQTTVDGSATPSASEPSLSKKEKRRAREAAKKAATTNEPTSKEHKCNVCQEEFSSRTKLFDHIKVTGHALADPRMADSFNDKAAKNKKGKRR